MALLGDWGWGYIEIIMAALCFFYLWALRNDNGLPWNWPFVGMLPSIVEHANRLHEGCTKIAEVAGGTYLFKGPWFLDMDMLLTVDPANIHHIMSGNFPNYPKGPKFKEIFDVLGDGIFNSDLDLWKTQRKTTRFLINHQRFHKFLIRTSRDKVEKGLIPVLDQFCKTGEILDLQDLFQRLTFDTTCKLVTGFDPGCVSVEFPDVPFARAMDDAEEAIVVRHIMPEAIWKLLRLINAGEERKYSQAWKTLDRVIGDYISKKREELKKSADSGNEDQDGDDLLTSFINEGKTMELPNDDKFLRDTILNLMIAGRDTTSSALTWFFYLLSENPNVEMKIREELRSITPPGEAEKWRIFDVQSLNKLVYLHGAICETLRLYPPVPFQHKEPIQPDILPSGHRVHPKMKVLFSLYAMGRMTSIWGKDCLEMKPERWISDRGTIKHEPSYKFLAFNAGPRTCLGKEVAFTQLKAVAASIIHNYQIKVVEGQVIEPNVSVILYIKQGLKVNVSKRWA
ncbi:OLC1v1008978C1 [Oldenlandia corymbosa var. corymbosa]|uniref:OLC1v1008978C1 n=1 Tax=Oldenlandia corymbosa var. corymbosa TaxID=529605 RepID=A0AAV1DR11_OLDCO|nr:OLC1v1008978C1 [Oldenlandia corymbosa var. corymbosa]